MRNHVLLAVHTIGKRTDVFIYNIYIRRRNMSDVRNSWQLRTVSSSLMIQ